MVSCSSARGLSNMIAKQNELEIFKKNKRIKDEWNYTFAFLEDQVTRYGKEIFPAKTYEWLEQKRQEPGIPDISAELAGAIHPHLKAIYEEIEQARSNWQVAAREHLELMITKLNRA